MKQKKILIKDASLLDLSSGYRYSKKDVLIKEGVIDLIENNIPYTPDMALIEGDKYILSPGFIDIHTHVYPEGNSLGIEADTVGIHKGVTSVFDAGSQGPENFQDFYNKVILENKTNVYALLNIARTGLEKERYEVSSLLNIDVDMVKEIYFNYKQFIRGIKVRASASTVGELGVKPVQIAKAVSRELNIPLVVHIGNYPPCIDDVLCILEEGDVVTHTFHGKPNGLFEGKGIRQSFIEARDKGVLFDVGHGSSSFDFNVFKRALELGFYPDFISTDIYVDNYNGPVYSLEQTINKLINLGMNVEDCISKVTYIPAQHFGLNNIGRLKTGFKADLNLFKIIHERRSFIDAEGNRLKGVKNIETCFILKDGNIIKQKKD